MNTLVHPNRSELAALLLGELSADSEANISSHVEECPDCQSVVETLDKLDDTFVANLRKSATIEPLEISPACAGVLRLAAEFPLGTTDATGNGGTRMNSDPPAAILDYQLGEPIGQGGMGTVYKALQTHLDKIVAIKVLPPDRLQDPAAVARFRREIRAVGKLDHPNLVRALNAGEVEGRYYLAMEFVDGLDLSRLVNRLGPLPISGACELIRQAALGLQHAHEHGMVHRDIKPGNIMLSQQGTVKVLDLGLALLPQQEVHELTSTGNVMGTLDYMPPEQGGDSHQVDIRADIYSLGATLYKLLTGHAIYHGRQYTTPVQKIRAIATEPAPPIQARRADVPAELGDIIHRMIARNPADRFSTPAEVAAVLAPFAEATELKLLLKRAMERKDQETLPQPAHDDSSLKLSAPSISTFPPTESLAKLAASPIRSQIPPGNRNHGWLLAAAGGVLALVFGVWIIVRDNKGKEIARIRSDDPVTVETIDDKPAKPAKPGKQPAPLRPGVPPVVTDSSAETLPPLSRLALVGSPAALPGVRSWTVETVGHRGIVRAVAYSSDGLWIASGGDDGTVRLWDAATQKLARLLVGHPYPVQALSFSPDGQWLVSAGFQETIVWQVASGLRKRSYRIEQFNPSSVGWSAEPNRFWLGGNDTKVVLFDVRQDEPVRQIETEILTDQMRVSPNGKWIAVKWRDSVELYVYDTTSGKSHWHYASPNPKMHHGVVATWAPDSRRLAVSDSLGSIEIWDIVEQKKLSTFREPLKQPQHVAILWAPKGDLVLIHCNHREVWNSATGTKVRDLGAIGDAAAWSPEGTTVVLAGSEGRVYVSDALDSQQDRIIAGHRAHIDLGGENSWSPDGKRLAAYAVNHDGPSRLMVLDMRTGEVLHSRDVAFEIGSLCWSPDSKQLAVCRWLSERKQAEVAIYEDDLKMPVRTVVVPQAKSPHGVVFSPDGLWFAVSDIHAGLWVYGVKEEIPSFEYPGHKGAELYLSWSPDSRELATVASNDHQVVVWNVPEGVVARRVPDRPFGDSLRLLRWSPDKGTLAMSNGGSIQFADAKTGEQLALTGHRPVQGFWQPASDYFTVLMTEGRCQIIRGTNAVSTSVGYDPTSAPWDRAGRTLLSGEGYAIRPWDIATGKRHGTLITTHNFHLITIGPTGHMRSTHPLILDLLRYVISTEAGDEVLTAADFSTRFAWKNDADRATLYVTTAGVKP